MPRSTSTPRGIDTVPLDAALGRVLAADVISPVDVPSFDRSNVDGFAVMSEDTFGASEEVPRTVELGEETIHTGIVPTTVIRSGTAVEIATGGMVPRGADAVVMVEYAETNGRRVADRQSHHTGKRRVVRRNGYHQRRDRAAPWSAPDQPRYRRPGRDRRRGGRGLAEADRRHSLDRGRDHRSGRADATGEGLRLERPGARRCGARARRRADAPRDHPRRHGRPQGKAPARARELRRRHALRRHEQGSGRPVVSRRRRTSRSRDRRARRRAQARQADLSGGDSRPSGRRAPGLSDVGDLHVSRVRRAGAEAARWSGRSGANRRPGSIGGEGQQRDRPHGVPAGGAGRSTADRGGGNVSRRVSDGTGIRQRHDVQPRRRLRDDRPARRDRPGGHARRRPAARPGSAAGRPRGDWQSLHRPGLSARRVAAAGRALQVSRGRQHRGVGRRQARRM